MKAKQIAQQIKELGLSMEQIQAEMDKTVRIEELLRGGIYSVNALKKVLVVEGDDLWVMSGNEFPNNHSAERAAKARLQRDRLEAYVAQENPDWNGVDDAAVIYIDGSRGWDVNEYTHIADFGSVVMPLKFAEDLCNKLNNGEIVL